MADRYHSSHPYKINSVVGLNLHPQVDIAQAEVIDWHDGPVIWRHPGIDSGHQLLGWLAELEPVSYVVGELSPELIERLLRSEITVVDAYGMAAGL